MWFSMHEFLYLFPWWHTDEDVNQKGCYSEDEWACVLEHTKQELPVNSFFWSAVTTL